MLFTALLPTLTLLLSAITLAPTAAASNSTLDSRTNTAGWTKEKCANVRGSYYGYNYNLGCLCENDINEFCANNGINSYFKSLISYYIQTKGTENWYPPNSQPTCDGGWSCGSLSKKSDGTCGKTTCDPRKCSSNGGCCPRGQTYFPSTGQCCGRVGCQSKGNTCTPVLQCTTYESNNVCCPSGTSGWTGYKTICCPKGQFEKDGQCVCADGFTKDGNTCKSNCPTGHSYCSTKCCPNGSSEKNKQCVCDSNQQIIQGDGANAKCVNRCPSGFTFYTKTCCPSGAKENSQGKCECTSSQQSLQGTGNDAKCVNKCPNGAQVNSKGDCECTSKQQTLQGTAPNQKCVNRCTTGFTFYSTKCCPAGASEKYGKCVCDSDQQTLQGADDKAKCVDKCTGGNKWCHSKCCKPYQDEINGQCGCPDGYLDTGRACTPKCKDSEKYNTATGHCDPICDESAGYFYQISWKKRGMCCKKGQTACNSVCCPPGKEEIGTTGVCCIKGSKVENGKCLEPTGGSGSGKRALSGRLVGEQINLSPSAVASYGLESNKNGKLCPAGLAACPIEGRESEYECIDSLSDLQSCGGCASLGNGQDCTLIPGARWMGCNVGRCEVYSCRKGYKKSSDGSTCLKL